MQYLYVVRVGDFDGVNAENVESAVPWYQQATKSSLNVKIWSGVLAVAFIASNVLLKHNTDLKQWEKTGMDGAAAALLDIESAKPLSSKRI